MVFSSLLQASPIPFSPIVRSYSVSDYNAGIQNWSIAQDDKGMGEACSKLLKTKDKRNVIAILMSTVYRYLPAKIKLFAFS